MKTSKKVDNLIAFLCVIAFALMLTFTLNSCTRTVYVSEETGDVVQYTKPNSSEFCAMARLDVTNYEIWWDKNTDVLYWAYLDHIGSWIGLNTKMCDVPIFPHGLKSIFISDDAVIGARCVIFQQVTIGSNNLRERGAPVIEDDCYIGSGAKIIGRCTIGHNARVGANCVVVKDVPPNTTAVVRLPGEPDRRVGSGAYSFNVSARTKF